MQQSEGTAAIRELAERLIGARYPFLPQAAQRARLFPGELPDSLALDLPLPPNSQLIGSASEPASPSPGAPPSGEHINIVVDAPGTADELLGFYERELVARGWFVAPTEVFRPGGFDAMQRPPSRTFCRSPRGPSLSVRVLPLAETNDIRIQIDTASPGPCANPAGARMGMPVGGQMLPALTAPAGVYMETLSGGGSQSRWSSNATAETDMPAAELEAHFAQQLAAAGWTRRDGGLTGPLAWSIWTSPGDGNWRGYLYVLEEPEPNRRWLHVRAELPGQGWSGGGATGWVSTTGLS